MLKADNHPGPDHLNFHAVIEGFSQRTPDSIVLVAPGGRDPLTFRRLFRHVQETQRALKERGVTRGDCVALVLPNGPEMTTASLAVMACAICAPLNPAMRAEEFDFFLSDLNPRVLLLEADSDSPARAIAREKHIPVIDLVPNLTEPVGMFTLSGEKGGSQMKEKFGLSSEIALRLHTSGTTLSPKLVSLTHRNLLISAASIGKTLKLHPHDRCLNIMPLYHIHGLCAIFSSLLAGGSIVSAPAFDSGQFFEWMDAFHPTWYTAAPPLHQAILAEAPSHTELIARYPLRLIRSASSALPRRLLTELETTFQAPVVESYGMTEAGPQICSNPLPPQARKAGSVGLPAGPEVAIMDQQGNFLESGETGEVVIRGDNVITGYHKNPEANQEAFINGWFHTGDQGFRDKDGYLFLTGRLNELINRGGEKISPREVEEVLLEHPAVNQVVIFPVSHPTLGQDVAGAVVLQEAPSVTPEELRKFVSRRLAHFKVPSRVKIVSEIPEGSGGKYHRRELAKQLGLGEWEPVNDGAPRNSLEKRIHEIWKDILKIDSIGIYDNFFELGGDSLRATQVMTRIQKAYKVHLPLTTIFDYPTIIRLAAVVERTESKGRKSNTKE